MTINSAIRTITVLTALSLLLTFCVPLAFAEQPPNIPQGDQPGAQASRFQSEAERFKAKVEKKDVKKPQIDIEEEAAKPAPEAGPAFVLKDVIITGASIFKPEYLKTIYESYIDKEVTFRDIDAISGKIKDEYKKNGYFTTIVYVPEQDIVEGKVEIRISEGVASDINIEGNSWFSSSLLRKYIHIKKNEPLNIFKLQRDILRLNQVSDLEVKVVIGAGKEQGASEITLKVADKMPYHIGASVDNQGTRLVGKYRNSFSFRSSNLSGLGDNLYYSTIMSATSSGNFATYSIPVDTYGTKAALDFTQFYSKLGQEIKAYGITGTTEIYTPHMSGEIYLSDMLQVNVDAGIEIKSIKKLLMNEITANDQLRLPYVAFDITKIDSFLGGGQTSFSPRATFGTSHFLGASKLDHPTSSRDETGGFFAKYEQSLRRFQKLFCESYMMMRSQFQFVSHTLPPSEQLQLGGAYSVRGYPEGDYLADYGATLNAEWFFPCYLIPKEWKLPHADQPLRYQVEPVIFFDLGGGGLMSVNPGEINAKVLMGLGGGLKMHFNRNLSLRLDWAQAIGGDGPAQGNGPSTFYITFQCEI
jgi:Hemolysin activation/secretion protein